MVPAAKFHCLLFSAIKNAWKSMSLPIMNSTQMGFLEIIWFILVLKTVKLCKHASLQKVKIPKI